MKIDTWHRLALLESVEYIRKQYKLHHGRSIALDHAVEITAPVRQSREFFIQLLVADPSIRPLLQYYGVLSLSRSLVIIATRSRREASLAQAHGLVPQDWNEIMSRAGARLTELKIKITSGTFSELRSASKGQSVLRHNSSKPNVVVLPEQPNLIGLEFSFADLCRRDPNLSPVAEQYLGYGRLNCLIREFNQSGDRIILKIPVGPLGAKDIDHLIRIVGSGAFACQHDSPTELSVVVEKASIDHELAFTDKIDVSFSVIGDIFLQRKLTRDNYLSQMESLFAMSYILSMISRYHSRIWLSVMNGTSRDEAYPLFLLMMDYIQSDFPRLVLEWLENGNFLPEHSAH